MLYDTHCHLNSEDMYPQLDMYIAKALENHVGYMNVVGYTLESSKLAVAIAKKYPFIYAVVGIGPNDCLETTEEDLKELEALLDEEKVVAVGEIGLDYYWDDVPKERQFEMFIKQMEMAERHHLPIVIHARDAIKDTYDLVKKYKAHGVMHCYSGSLEMAREFVKLGFKISLGGPVTFKNARVPKEVASGIDLKNLLIETDSPYLTPHPFRGKPNDPSYVYYVAKQIADLKGIDEQEVIEATMNNAFEAFNIKEKK